MSYSRDIDHCIAGALWCHVTFNRGARAVLAVATDQQHNRADVIIDDMIKWWRSSAALQTMFEFDKERQSFRSREIDSTFIRIRADEPERLAGMLRDDVLIVFLGRVDERVEAAAQGSIAGAKNGRILHM